MPRDLSSGAEQAVFETNNTSAFLLQLYFNSAPGLSEQVFRITTASQDIVTSGVDDIPDSTWQSVAIPQGGTLLGMSSAEEGPDLRSAGLSLSLDGVDQEAIGILQNNFFRGHKVEIWKIWLDDDTGEITASMLFWKGYQNDSWEIEEKRNTEEAHVTVSTRVVSRLAILAALRPVVTNITSHNQMLSRAGVGGNADIGFRTIPMILNKKFYWGTDKGQEYGDGRPVRRRNEFGG